MADDIYSELTVNQDGSGDQMYVPLMADDKDNELTVNQDGSGTQLTIRWTKQNHSNGYIVAVGDDSCAIPERDPRPCLLVQNTVSFTNYICTMTCMWGRAYIHQPRSVSIPIPCIHTD